MIDIATYKNMHEPHDKSAHIDTGAEEELEAEYMSQDEPRLGDEFFMCLPTSIPGFNMQTKAWG